jgi:hypothetical protein
MKFFLGLILFFVILWYSFKLFLQYGLPWLVNRFMKKQQEKYSQFGQQQNPYEKKEGEVEIKNKKAAKPKADEGFGEYVDFEDIKE